MGREKEETLPTFQDFIYISWFELQASSVGYYPNMKRGMNRPCHLPKVTRFAYFSARTLIQVIRFPKPMLCTKPFTPLSHFGRQSTGKCLQGATKAIQLWVPPTLDHRSRILKIYKSQLAHSESLQWHSAMSMFHGRMAQWILPNAFLASQCNGDSCHCLPEHAFHFRHALM